MAKAILERNGVTDHKRFVPPSYASDVTKSETDYKSLSWKVAAGVLAGGWLLMRYPKTAILGLVAAGAIGGMFMSGRNRNPYQSSTPKLAS